MGRASSSLVICGGVRVCNDKAAGHLGNFKSGISISFPSIKLYISLNT